MTAPQIFVGKWQVALITIEGVTRQLHRGHLFKIETDGTVKHAINKAGKWHDIPECNLLFEGDTKCITNNAGVRYEIEKHSQFIIELSSNDGYFRYEARRVV